MSSDELMPFSINVPEEVLVDLRRRLRETRWSDETDAEPWRYGPPLADVLCHRCAMATFQ